MKQMDFDFHRLCPAYSKPLTAQAYMLWNLLSLYFTYPQDKEDMHLHRCSQHSIQQDTSVVQHCPVDSSELRGR